MNNEFKSLREQIEISLDKYGYLRKIGNIGKYIHSDRESALLIDNLLRDNALSTTEMSIAFDVAQKRAVHSLLTWLVGLIFTEFGDVFNSISSIVEDTDDRIRSKEMSQYLWLITALNHDIGYYLKGLKNGALDYRKTFKAYYLLDDNEIDKKGKKMPFSEFYPKAFAYTYEEIENYDKYARKFHYDRKDKEEMIDHGIYGGFYLYDLYMKKSSDSDNVNNQNAIVKTCCLAIAQHNIFRSKDLSHDKEYKDGLRRLHSTSPFRIGMDSPLLLYLCIVDTIECIKKLTNLQTDTILKKIRVKVTKDEISINYIDLYNHIQKNHGKNTRDVFDNYLNGIKNFHTWTICHTYCDDEDSKEYKIRLSTDPSIRVFNIRSRTKDIVD